MSTRESKGKSDWEDQDLLDKDEAAERIRRALDEEDGAVGPPSGLRAARVKALKARLQELEEQARLKEANPSAE